MATIKSYTDLEQSKVLVKILPLESADMYYINSDINKIIIRKWKDEMHDEDDVPCWNLASLLGVLPVIIGDIFSKNALRLRMDNSERDFNVWYINIDNGMVEEGLDIIKNNPVDACYEMILKLYELNLL